MKKLLCCLLFCMPVTISWAEDIELYVGNNLQRSGERPQVLIIFDTSGSMAKEETIRAKYDPTFNYGNNGYVYYSTNSNIPTIGSNNRFLATDNGCHSSISVLNSNGFYNGKLKYYRPKSGNKSAKWLSLSGSPSKANGNYIDCLDDVTNNDPINANGVADGLPSNDKTDIKNPPPYAVKPSSYPSFDSGVTLYSSNYIYWHNNSIASTRSRMEIAKETVTDLIESAPGVSFGLEVFNYNNTSTNNGGRIAYGIKDRNNYVSADIIALIDDKISADGRTPLCESLYEAALYFGGKNVKYGNGGGTQKPVKDPTVSVDGVYKSPFAGCSNEVFVILMTDGEPVGDEDADSLVDGLISGASGSRLDDLAEWMHNNDINTNVPGTQTATIFTIGYGKDADSAGVLLQSTATKGGGKYYPASDPSELLTSMQAALLEILKVSTSFTSPSIASNNFDRTETLDSVYYAMFLPDRGPRWSGNLKKLKVSGDQQLDRTGAVAISASGNISSNAKTYWSSGEADGPEVKKGGVAEMLRNKTNRSLYSDIGTGGKLTAFTYANAKSSFGSDDVLAKFMNVDADTLESHFLWASGIDVDDQDDDGRNDDIREDVFGDPLHSKPLVVNYGGSKTNQDVRIAVGTNAGFIHMFDDAGTTIDESWAFIPKELYENIPILRENSSTAKVYGIDGTPTVHIDDKNGDGSVNAIDGDTAWLFFGLRRGGTSYYALDISIPNAPKLMWHIDQNTAGFSELAQSWSKVKIGYSKINKTSGVAKPVAFISGGYDVNKDNSGPGKADSAGRAIYMVDAESGELLWSATPASTSGKNLQWSNIQDSIPSGLAIMDSDSDGLIDRVYAGDMGGNIWRIDMPGASAFSTTSPWTIHHLAKLGDSTRNSNEDDRRFFNEPSIVRAIITETIETTTEIEGLPPEVTVSRHERKYDAVLIGSGDRSTPTSTDTHDRFFMIKDPDIITRSFGKNNHVIPDTIELGGLYDFTNNPYGNNLSTQDKEDLDILVSRAAGWYMDFVGSGEKSVSAATAIAGVAYFNSFLPSASSSDNSCSLSAGIGKLYAVDLSQGSTVYNWRTTEVGDRVPDTPTIVIPPEVPTEDTNGDGIIDENDQAAAGKLRFVGVGSGVDADGNKGTGTITLCDAANCDPVEGIQLETMRTHLYITESQ